MQSTSQLEQQQEQMETNIIEYSLEGVMVGVSINLRPDLLKQIDEAKGTQSRSGFIVKAVYEYLQPSKTDWDVDRKQLLTQLETNKDTQRRLDAEVAFLRDQNATLTDALTQRLLIEPKKSFWDHFRRGKE